MHRDDMREDVRARAPRGPRRLVWTLASAGFLSLAALGSYPLLSGRASAPVYSLAGARHALTQAREADAARWAPSAMRDAEASWNAASLEHRIQESRFVLFRNFGPSRDALASSEEKSRKAAAEADRKKREARAAADAAITEADSVTGRSSEFANAMDLGMFERVLLGRSKVALREAHVLFSQGSFLQAADRAKMATAQARTVTERAVATASRFTDSAVVAGWRRMVDQTVEWSRSTGRIAVVVFKENHRLTVYDNGRPIRTFAADMGYKSVNDKLHSGDSATPEGRYSITAKKGAGRSTYYKALLLDYPNAEDRANFDRMKRSGRIPRGARLGGMIEIHGEGGRGKDWTRGCVALANPDIDALFSKVDVGTPVTIVGGDGTGGVFTELVRQSAKLGTERSQ